MILHGGEPLFFPGGDTGILLVHGFTGAPGEMLLLGRALQEQGYTALAIRLAGHGTSAEDLARTSWQDWYASLWDGYAILSKICKRIFVIGQSMGGLLTLLAGRAFQLEGIATIAAPIFIHEDRQLHRLPPREFCKGKFRPKKRRKEVDVPEECNFSYSEMPLESIHEVLELIGEVKEALPRIKVPILVIQSDNDHTVSPRSGKYIYNNLGSYQKELYSLDRSGHLVTIGCQREEAFQRIIEFIKNINREV